MLNLIGRVQSLFNPEPVSVRLSFTDTAGQLRQMAAAGPNSTVGKRSERQRRVLQTHEPRRFALSSRPGLSLAILPVSDQQAPTAGVVEVIAPTESMSERWPDLRELVLQAHIDPRSWPGSDNSGREITLARELMRAVLPQEAVRAIVRYCFEVESAPIAAWYGAEGASEMKLVTAMGVTKVVEGRLRRQMAALPCRESGPGHSRAEAKKAFRQMVGRSHIDGFQAGGAVIMTSGRSAQLRTSLRAVGPLLSDALTHLLHTRATAERDPGLDIGLAWTAHELRNPLLAARASLEYLLMSDADKVHMHPMLKRMCQELEDLSEFTSSILEWSTGVPSLKHEALDLSHLLEEVAASCRVEGNGSRLKIDSPDTVPAIGDARHLRSALTNIVRNALIYSPANAPVHVSLAASGGHAILSIADKGPGIRPEEREAIFSPFMRGRASRSSPGTGMGLFVARRVIEAHNGRIWVSSNGHGATFYVELPAIDDRCLNPARAS